MGLSHNAYFMSFYMLSKYISDIEKNHKYY